MITDPRPLSWHQFRHLTTRSQAEARMQYMQALTRQDLPQLPDNAIWWHQVHRELLELKYASGRGLQEES